MLNEKSQVPLLSAGPLKEELAYEQPVYKTWEISYNSLTDMAKTILNICSFLDRGKITDDPFHLAATSTEVIDMLQ